MVGQFLASQFAHADDNEIRFADSAVLFLAYRQAETRQQFLTGNGDRLVKTYFRQLGQLAWAFLGRHFPVQVIQGNAQEFFVAEPAQGIEASFVVGGQVAAGAPGPVPWSHCPCVPPRGPARPAYRGSRDAG